MNGRKLKLSYAVVGVPQGSVLGAPLFFIYMLDISEDVKGNMKVFVNDNKNK